MAKIESAFVDLSYLDTLAAAHAECGEFEQAVRWQERAIEVVTPEARGEYETRLALYRAGTPYRDRETDA